MLAYAALRFAVAGVRFWGWGWDLALCVRAFAPCRLMRRRTCCASVGASRVGFRFLPPQNLSQGSYCLLVCLVQFGQQLGCCGFVAFPEGIVHAFRQLVHAGE